MSPRKKIKKPEAPEIPAPASPRPAAPDRMPRAWAILALALLLLAGLEWVLTRWPRPAGVRVPAFWSALAPEPKVQPTVWPTPRPLPPQPGKLHTSPGRVRRILAPPRPGQRRLVRVAYFADSVAEGDLICGTLRLKLQERFGGQGLGWVGLGPIDAQARDDIQQSFGPEWERHSIAKPDWEGQDFGPGGQVWRLQASPGHVQYRAMRGLPAFAQLPPATLWYGPLGSRPAQAELRIDGGELRELRLDGQGLLNHVPLNAKAARSLDLALHAGPDQPFYGVSFDKGSGLDNFNTRGSHGGPLKRLDLGMLRELQARRGYKLVLVHYGINALIIRSDPAYKWYRRELAAGLRQLQKGLPGAAMVLVTVTDRGVRVGDAWASDPYLPGLLAAQEAAASDVGIPCINSFDLMGGPGTMKAWAESKPRLAERDYTHLSPLGAKRFGEKLWEELGRSGGKPAKVEP